MLTQKEISKTKITATSGITNHYPQFTSVKSWICKPMWSTYFCCVIFGQCSIKSDIQLSRFVGIDMCKECFNTAMHFNSYINEIFIILEFSKHFTAIPSNGNAW